MLPPRVGNSGFQLYFESSNPAVSDTRLTSLIMTSVLSHWFTEKPLFFRYISPIPPGWLGGQLTPLQYTYLSLILILSSSNIKGFTVRRMFALFIRLCTLLALERLLERSDLVFWQILLVNHLNLIMKQWTHSLNQPLDLEAFWSSKEKKKKKTQNRTFFFNNHFSSLQENGIYVLQ